MPALRNLEMTIEPDTESGTLRYRWRLVATGEEELISSGSYSTRREATRQGEVELERAQARGALRTRLGRLSPRPRQP